MIYSTIVFSSKKAVSWLNYQRNSSVDKDPAMAIALKWWIPCTLLCATYSFSRLTILVEDVIGLRDLPPSAYETVNYGQFSPIL